MARESGIERRGCELLQAQGCLTPKLGMDGWPDRLVIWAPGQHFWIEWKNGDGKLTKAQMARIPVLAKAGERVYVCRSPEEALHVLWREKGT